MADMPLDFLKILMIYYFKVLIIQLRKINCLPAKSSLEIKDFSFHLRNSLYVIYQILAFEDITIYFRLMFACKFCNNGISKISSNFFIQLVLCPAIRFFNFIES